MSDKRPLCKNCGFRHALGDRHRPLCGECGFHHAPGENHRVAGEAVERGGRNTGRNTVVARYSTGRAATVTAGMVGVTDNVTGRGVTRQMSRDIVTDLERRVVALEERVAALEKRRQTDADRQRKRRGSSNGRAAAP